MRIIKQRTKSDCFPCCLAILMEIPWKEAVQLVHPTRKKGDRYHTNIRFNMFPLLMDLGFTYRKSKKLKNLKRDAIVLLKQPESPTIYHAVVWSGEEQRIIDPISPREWGSLCQYQPLVHAIFIF